MEDTFTLSELETANAVRYAEVEAYGKKRVVLGSVNSEDMIEWLEANDAEKKEAGLRLLVKSVVEVVKRDEDGTIVEAKRIPKDVREDWVERFRKKDARENGKVIREALKLNGLDRAAALIKSLGNASGGASPAASPTDSPSPQAE